MGKSDWQLFNCSEEHESGYVRNQYAEPIKVKAYLEKKCESNDINNSTHKEVYEMLKAAGFRKK